MQKIDVGLDPKGVQMVQEAYVSLLGPIIWTIIALAAIAVTIIFVQKVVKFLVIQCDIMLVWNRLSSRIVFSENLSRNLIIGEFEELSQQILRKNQSGFLGNISFSDSTFSTFLRHIGKQ